MYKITKEELKKLLTIVLAIFIFAASFTLITWGINPSIPYYVLFTLFIAIIIFGIILSYCLFALYSLVKLGDYGVISSSQQQLVYMRDGTHFYVPQEPRKSAFVEPKDVEPYVFYCSRYALQKFEGYAVFCPTCRKRMKLYDPDAPKQKPKEKTKDNKKCVLCHSLECPTCKKGVYSEENEACKEECPYCESIYHHHCWELVLKKFGNKCAFCMETPPPELMPSTKVSKY